MVDARTATAKDFDQAAQTKASSFWFWAVVAGVIGYFWHWWATVPGLIAALRIVQSIHATKLAGALRAGTYPIPNPNNGAPDGDAGKAKSALPPADS
jgi:hypothetical protein